MDGCRTDATPLRRCQSLLRFDEQGKERNLAYRGGSPTGPKLDIMEQLSTTRLFMPAVFAYLDSDFETVQ